MRKLRVLPEKRRKKEEKMKTFKVTYKSGITRANQTRSVKAWSIGEAVRKSLISPLFITKIEVVK
jgi:hypothetical protein